MAAAAAPAGAGDGGAASAASSSEYSSEEDDETWEERAWRHWEETEGSRSLVPPLAVPELPRGAKPASLQAPFVVRGLLNGSRALDGFGGVGWLRTPPVADLVVDFFSNASARMAVVPDSRGRLGDVVERILAGGPQKLGTEMIFREHPA